MVRSIGVCLLGTPHVMTDEQISRFVQYYQRLTEHCLVDLPGRVNHLFRLDEQRVICDYRQPLGAVV